MLKISVAGTLRVTDRNGSDVTPKSAKARGLVAMLALSPDMRRSRMWLRGKLWSASGASQASDSLRQCLTEIRKALGEHSNALTSNRSSVGLDPALVTVTVDRDPALSGENLCDDLEISDPAFKSWLVATRDRMEGNLPETRPGPDTGINGRTRAVVVLAKGQDIAPESAWIYQMMRENIALLLREGGDIEVVTDQDFMPRRTADTHCMYFVVLDVSLIGHQAVISARLDSAQSTARTLWNSGQIRVNNDGSDKTIWELHKLSHWAFEQTARTIAAWDQKSTGALNAYALAVRGRNRLFSFTRESLIDADRLFAAAYDLEPRGTYLAWRHFLRNTAVFEHLTDDFLEPVNKVELLEHAVMDSSTNSFVLSVAAQDAFVRQNELGLAQAFVKQAVEKNEANPLAWAFQSNIHILAGDHQKAIQASNNGELLASTQGYRGFWSLFSCMTHMAARDYEGAAFHANMSHYLMPRLVAAQRFLYAVNEAMGRESQALTIMRKIKKREPDFSKQHFFRSTYPVATMREMPIMDLLA